METCPICYSECENKIECGHYYHPECIKDYVANSSKKTCCCCFKTFEEKYLYIYNSNNQLIWYLNNDIIKIIKSIISGKYINICRWIQLMFIFNNKCRIEVINRLIELGANINVKDSKGKTPLMIALHHNCSIEVINRLIELGANINAKDSKKDNTIDDCFGL